MANLSNINGKFLFTDGDFLKIGNLAPINNISGTESGVSITNSNVASIALTSTGANGKTFLTYTNPGGDYTIYDISANSPRLTINTGGDATFTGSLNASGQGYFGPVGTGNATTKAEMISNAVLRLKPHDNNSTNMNFAQVDNGASMGIQVTNGPGTANWDIALSPFGGNVGIGTPSPSAKLEVVTTLGADAIRLNYGQSADIFLGFNAANPRILLQDNSNVVTHNFQSNGDNYIVGSNVGIGTTTPDGKLEVAGGTTLGFRLSNAGDSSAYDQVRMTYGGYNSGAPTVIFMPLTTPGGGNVYTTFLFQNTNGINASANNNANVAIDGTLQVGRSKGSGETTLIMNNYDTSLAGTNQIQNSIRMSGRYWSNSASQLVETRINSVHQLSDGNGGSALTFMTQTGGSGVVEQMRIDRDGNVGINNTSPTSKLNVNGNDNGSAEFSVTLGSTTTAGGTANNASSTPVNKTLLTGYSIPYSGQTNSRLTTCGFLEFASTAGWTGSQRTWAITSGYDIGGQDSGAGGNKMAIILGNAQNVSPQIGTNGAIGESGDGDGANSLVACYWDNALNMRLANSSRLYTGAGGSAAVPMITPGTDKNTGIWYPTSDTWAISTAGEERLRITSGGNVLIGATGLVSSYDAHAICRDSPSGYALIVKNSNTSTTNNTVMQLNRAETTATTGGYALIYRQGNASTGTNRMIVFANGNIQNSNNSYGSLSDKRLKENIIDATPKLDDLMKVKVRNFNLKGEETKQIGVVAQELEEVFPSMIDESKDPDSNDETLYKSVKYSVFVPMLIKAIQELKAEIELLKNK